MSVWTYLFDNEWSQRRDIEGLRRAARRRAGARSRERQDQGRRIAALEEEIGELTLICRSLLTCLRRQGTLDPHEFQKVMAEVDAEDGAADGKVTPPPPEPPPPTPRRTRHRR